tara:strand:+ start:308 stop:586 length:279 start_codon:yes stop_codon:yes gene_type:complete
LYPDIRYDCLTYHLIVEIDEHRHRGRAYKCDERRMYDIIAKLGQPCVFVRYNPDNVVDGSLGSLSSAVERYLPSGSPVVYNDFGLCVEYMFY